jgi:hypothetical protein
VAALEQKFQVLRVRPEMLHDSLSHNNEVPEPAEAGSSPDGSSATTFWECDKRDDINVCAKYRESIHIEHWRGSKASKQSTC